MITKNAKIAKTLERVILASRTSDWKWHHQEPEFSVLRGGCGLFFDLGSDRNSLGWVVGQGHLRGAGAAKPEMFYAIRGLRFGQDRALRANFRFSGIFNHENFAFPQINQWSRAGGVRTFGQHGCLL